MILPVNLNDVVGQSKPRQVPTEEAIEFARQEGLLFVEASAKSGLNVEHAFVNAAKDILDKIRRGVFDDSRVCHSPSISSIELLMNSLQSPGVRLNQTSSNNLALEQSSSKTACCS